MNRVVLPILVLVGCANEPTSTTLAVELADLGVAEAVQVGEHVELLDADHALIGNVLVESGAIKVALHDRDAALIWDPVAAWARCDDVPAVIARQDRRGWHLLDAPELDSCVAMFAIGERVAAALATHLPWRTVAAPSNWAEQTEAPAGCNTISTWTWGSSCGECYGEAFNQYCRYDRQNCGTPASSQSCSSGSVYTTCSSTFCSQ